MESEETNEVLDYVMRTLDVLDETAPPSHPRRKLVGTLEGLGMRILEADTFFSKGYEKYLSPLVRIEDPDTGEEIDFPPTSCFVVAEKP